MCTYLAQRGSTYYFRRVIPVELRPLLGGKKAKKLLPGHTIATDKLLDDARAALSANGHTSPSARAMSDCEWLGLEGAEHFAREADEAEARYDERAKDRDEFRERLTFTTAQLSSRALSRSRAMLFASRKRNYGHCVAIC